MKKHPQLVALGKQLKVLRKQTGLSQEDFASEVELDRTYYSGVERGERNIATINLIKIAIYLKVEVGDLFPKRLKLSKLSK